jgi:hypothetical protein
MEVNSKYNINDNVWVVCDNKVVQQKIRGVEISAYDEDYVEIIYSLLNDQKYLENAVFKTKQELIDSL